MNTKNKHKLLYILLEFVENREVCEWIIERIEDNFNISEK